MGWVWPLAIDDKGPPNNNFTELALRFVLDSESSLTCSIRFRKATGIAPPRRGFEDFANEDRAKMR